MAHSALAVGVVLALRLVAREAQGAVGHETRDRGLAVTGVAGDVRLNGWLVCRVRVRAGMARGAVAGGGVMVLVTGATRRHRRIGRQRHGCRVASHAAQRCVCRVGEGHRTVRGRTIPDGDVDGRGTARRELARGVTRRAVARRGRLVMTDLAAPWRSEGQAGMFAR